MDLTGSILIAMPGMGDPRFEKAVIMICDHSNEGAMGLVINHPTKNIRLNTLLDFLEIKTERDLEEIPILNGGPIEKEQGFVMHVSDGAPQEGEKLIAPNIALSTTRTVLEDIANGEGPQDCLIILGYAGWSAGQLEDEIMENVWLTARPSSELIFHDDPEEKWSNAMAILGITPHSLSIMPGNA